MQEQPADRTNRSTRPRLGPRDRALLCRLRRRRILIEEDRHMSGMIVHGVPGSPYVRAALLALEEKGASYELASMAPGTLKQPSHLSRHPFGRIPAFEHDGWMLYETQAIMRYVDAVVPGPPLQPEEPRAAARMDQLIGIVDWYLMPQVS